MQHFYFSKILGSFLFIALSLSAPAQNLVPNPSFEISNKKPNSMLDSGLEFDRAVQYWRTANLASTDYITSRFSTAKFKAITPKTGESMVGMVTHGDFWAEYVQVKLKEPLEAGKSYYVEYWVANNSGYFEKGQDPICNPMYGALFSEKFFIKDKKIIYDQPQIGCKLKSGFANDQWTKISGIFMPEKPFTHITIGQFQNKDTPWEYPKAYFFLDDVLVEKFNDISTTFKPPTLEKEKLQNIYFELDKYNLLAESFPALDEVVKFLLANPNLRIKIIGHTDNQGESYHNQTLSTNRAKAVYNYLTNHGINLDLLNFEGLGATNPIASNETKLGRQKNRRVEFWTNSETQTEQTLDNYVKEEKTEIYTFSSVASAEQLEFLGLYEKDNITQYDNLPFLILDSKIKPFDFTSEKAPFFNSSIILSNSLNSKPHTLQFLENFALNSLDLKIKKLVVIGLKPNLKIEASAPLLLVNGSVLHHPKFANVIRVFQEHGIPTFSIEPDQKQFQKAKRALAKSNPNIKTEDILQFCRAMNIKELLKDNEKTLIIYPNGTFEDIQNLRKWIIKFVKTTPLIFDQNSIYQTKNKPKEINKVKTTSFLNGKLSYNNKILHQYYPILHPENLPRQPKDIISLNKINIDKYRMQYPCLISFYKNESENLIGIPIEIIEVQENKYPAILLKKGSYSVILRDKKKRKQINVKVK